MVFGPTINRVRTRRILTLLMLVWMALPAALFANECKVRGESGQPRDCSATEALAHCLDIAAEARRQCIARNPFYFRMHCSDRATLDYAVCFLTFPLMTVLR